MWTEAVKPYFKMLSEHLFGETEENYEKIRIVGLQAEIQTRNFSNPK
jgi:hypothetical protein